MEHLDVIELSDIIAVRLTCTNCHAALSLPLSTTIEVAKLRHCPYCLKQPWAASQRTGENEKPTAGQEDKMFGNALEAIRSLPGGFTLALLVKSRELVPTINSAVTKAESGSPGKGDSEKT
jgi:hypothetical protein